MGLVTPPRCDRWRGQKSGCHQLNCLLHVHNHMCHNVHNNHMCTSNATLIALPYACTLSTSYLQHPTHLYYIVAMFSHSQTMSGQRPPSGTIFSLHILKWVIASCFGVSVLVRCCIGVKRTILKVKMVPKEQNLNSDITAWSVREQSRSERDRICSFPSTYLHCRTVGPTATSYTLAERKG